MEHNTNDGAGRRYSDGVLLLDVDDGFGGLTSFCRCKLTRFRAAILYTYIICVCDSLKASSKRKRQDCNYCRFMADSLVNS